jgi:hypothetical protein
VALGLELCVDTFCFGSNIHVGCVVLYISFPKYPRSSQSKFRAKSYRRFSADTDEQDRVQILGPDHVYLVRLCVFSCVWRAQEPGDLVGCWVLTGSGSRVQTLFSRSG